MSDQNPVANRTAYKQPFSSRFTIGIVVVLGLGNFVAMAATILEIGTRDTGPPPWWFHALCWLVWGWLAYVFLFRTAVSLRVDGSQLVWRAPVRGGSVGLAEVRSIRARGLFLFRFRFVRGGSILVFDGAGLSAFITKLHKANPEIAVWRQKLRR